MARGYGRARSRPSMGSYIQFAWRDAMALAVLLEEEWDARRVHDDFDRRTEAQRQEIESVLRDDICDIIRATQSRRPAIIRRIQKETKRTDIAEFALLFAIMAQVRNMDELDRLTPGGGNRDTCAACYQQEAYRRHVRIVHEFPYEVFSAYGSSVDFWGDNDDD